MKMISLDSTPEKTVTKDQIDPAVQKGRISVISWMGLARRSSGCVQKYLTEQGFDSDVIPLIIASLREDRTIDDERLARKIVRQRQGRQEESRMAMANRLAGKGIELSVIEHVLAVDNPDEQDQQTAASILQQRFGKLIDDLNAKQNQLDSLDFNRKRAQLTSKAYRFLLSRGFSEDIVFINLHQADLMPDGFE